MYLDLQFIINAMKSKFLVYLLYTWYRVEPLGVAQSEFTSLNLLFPSLWGQNFKLKKETDIELMCPKNCGRRSLFRLAKRLFLCKESKRISCFSVHEEFMNYCVEFHGKKSLLLTKWVVLFCNIVLKYED